MKSTKTLFRLLVSGALTASMLLPSSLAVYQAKVKADSLYLRSAPGGSVIATLSQGTTVAVTNNSSEWYKVIVDGKEGYVSGSYLTGTTATDFSVGSGRITCSSTVNLRSEANTSSSILTSLSNGTAVTITGVSGGWYKVSVNRQDRLRSPGLCSGKQLFRFRQHHDVRSGGHRRQGILLLDRQSPRRGEHLVRYSGIPRKRHRRYAGRQGERLVQGFG